MWHRKLIIALIVVAGLFLILVNIDFWPQNEIDRSKGEELVHKYLQSGEVDSVLLEETNVEVFIPNEPYFLFIENSFNGDFNGSIYSKEVQIPDSIRFEEFYLTRVEKTSEQWTKVYGKW